VFVRTATKFGEYLLLLTSEPFVFRLLSKTVEIKYNNFIFSFVWVWNLVSHIKGGI